MSMFLVETNIIPLSTDAESQNLFLTGHLLWHVVINNINLLNNMSFTNSITTEVSYLIMLSDFRYYRHYIKGFINFITYYKLIRDYTLLLLFIIIKYVLFLLIYY